MASECFLFAALPEGVVGDDRLTELDFRVLCKLALHDRMSLATGGQGAWVSRKKIAAAVGSHVTSVSTSITKLLRLGYIVRERRATNRRFWTYRVVYCADHVAAISHKESPANNLSSDDGFSGENTEGCSCQNIENIPEEDISLSEQKHSPKGARACARAPAGKNLGLGSVKDSEVTVSDIARQLAQFERLWKQGEITNPLSNWYEWLMELWDHIPDEYDDPTRNRLNRLLNEVESALEGEA